MNYNLLSKLSDFAQSNRMSNKGALCVALVVTHHAKAKGLPLDGDLLLTESGGQVAGLGKANVQSILKDHGITRVLAEEGGRTSRGSVKNMRNYVVFLNDLEVAGAVDLEEVELWWVNQVRLFFAGKPFKLKYDPAKSLRTVIQDVIMQAEKRQRENPGTQYTGAVLQHLIGAKLELVVGPGVVEHHGASVADSPTDRAGDFLLEDVSIHVTTAPGEAVLRKCRDNINAGLKPILLTLGRKTAAAEQLAENAGVADRLDIFDAEQFIAGNLYEIGKFGANGRRATTNQLIETYNTLVDIHETDPSLKINSTA